MKQLLLSSVILLNFTSCFKGKGAYFEITNESEKPLQVRIVPNITPLDLNRGEIISIAPGEMDNYWSNMNSIPREDGDYLLLYKLGSDSTSMQFGYYTNGYQDEKIKHILISPDTVIFDETYSMF